MNFARFKANPIITRPLPEGVTYDLSDKLCTTITIPAQSTWSSGLHWHERHTEYLRVVKGSVWIRLDSRSFVVSAATSGEPDAIVRVERHARHEWCRADRFVTSSEKDDQEVVVIETTDPADDEKHLFFWNLNGAILEAQHKATAPHEGPLMPLWSAVSDFGLTLRLFIIFAELDNYPALIDGDALSPMAIARTMARLLQGVLVHTMLWFSVSLGKALRISAIEERYTPKELLSSKTANSRPGSKKRA